MDRFHEKMDRFDSKMEQFSWKWTNLNEEWTDFIKNKRISAKINLFLIINIIDFIFGKISIFWPNLEIFDYFRILFLLGLGFTQSQSSACLLLSASFIWSVHTPSSRLFLQQYPSALWHLNYIQSGLGFHVTSHNGTIFKFSLGSP